MGSYNSELPDMALWGEIPSTLGRYRCSGSPARWSREPPIGGETKCFRNWDKHSVSNCGSMKRLPSVAWPHGYLWASTLCSRLERDFTFFKGVTTEPVLFFFLNTWVAFSMSEIEIRLCTNTWNLAITDTHVRTHTHANMSMSSPKSRPNRLRSGSNTLFS